MTQILLVYVMASSRKEADQIAVALVEECLAACISIVPAVSSRYYWKGKMETRRELLLMIKTSRHRYKALETRVKTLHSDSVPEILAVPVATGNPEYLKWVRASLRKRRYKRRDKNSAIENA